VATKLSLRDRAGIAIDIAIHAPLLTAGTILTAGALIAGGATALKVNNETASQLPPRPNEYKDAVKYNDWNIRHSAIKNDLEQDKYKKEIVAEVGVLMAGVAVIIMDGTIENFRSSSKSARNINC